MTVLSALCMAMSIVSSHAGIDRLSAGGDRSRDRDPQETATAFFNFIARQLTVDKDDDCIASFDRFVSPLFTLCEGDECKSKEEVTQLFCETEHEEAGPIFIRSGFKELADDVAVLSGVWVMQQLDECEEVAFDAELHFGPNGRISKWIDTEYDAQPCGSSTTTTKAANSDSGMRPKQGREAERKRILDKHYDLGMDLYNKHRDHNDTMDEELDDIVSDFTVDFSFCAAVNGEKQCYDGAEGFKQAFKRYLETNTFDHTDYSKSITRKDDNLYEIVSIATCENDDGSCQKSIETNMFTFRGTKIQYIEYDVVITDCKKKKKTNKKAKAGAIDDEREDTITDFYDLLMDKLFSADADDLTAKDAVNAFMEMTSETMSLCSFGSDDTVKRCQDKREIIEMLKEHRENSDGTVFEGVELGTMSVDGDRVSVEVTLRHLDEETGCVLEGKQMDEFVFDVDGKIAEYDSTADSHREICDDEENENRLYEERKPSACRLEKDAGFCRGWFRAWYYDTTLGYCAGFTYGGCGGNDNRFNDLSECEAMCGGQSEGPWWQWWFGYHQMK